MIRVQLWGSLKTLADGNQAVEVEARTLGGVRRELERAYPGLKAQIDRGVSFAVDGTIIRDDWLLPVTSEQEIIMMPYMTGG